MSLDYRLWVFCSIYYNPKIAYRSGHLMMEISPRNEEMNDHLSLLLQGYAAKRKLAELFQSEGFVKENQPPIAIVGHELVPAFQTGIKQSRKSLRENRRKRRRVRNPTPTAQGTSQQGQMEQDLTVSGFVLALVLVGVILATNGF